jgi:hypothetical protein
MRLKTEKAVSILLTATLLLGMIFIAIPYAKALGEPTATVRFIPSPVTVTGDGQAFDVACVVEGAYNLSGVDVQIEWDTNYMTYVSHTPTVTVEDFPAPIAPSPYAGIIHAPKLTLKDEVDGPLGPGTYWFGFATLGGPGFNGSGTAFVMSFLSQNVPFGDPLNFFDITINITNCDLARSTSAGGGALDRTLEDGIVRIYEQEFSYPAWPKLSINPTTVEFDDVLENETIDVVLHGFDMDTQTVTDLAAFWDVAGVDMYINFDPTLFQCVEVNVDPDGWFAAFWASGIFVIAADIDNVAGTVHVAFSGYGEPHIPPFGTGSVAELVMQAIVEFTTLPPTSPITIANPLVTGTEFVFDSQPGLIDIANPVTTSWHELSPSFCDGPFTLTGWTDGDGNGVLSDGDIVVLENTGDGFYFRYVIEDVTVTLNLTEQPFGTVDDYVWAASLMADGLANNGVPGHAVGTDDPYNGFGVPDWTGNFSLTYPFVSVSEINVTHFPFTGDEYTVTLTPGVDYAVHAGDDLVELLIPQDDHVINELWVDGVNNSLNGWPWINYLASGISSVYVDMMNGTARPGINLGYATPPPSEWWYDPDWPWELEGWWALGYFCPAPWCWPAGSMWWINYTAASYMTIEYDAEPDPNPRYLEFMGDYSDALGNLTSPIGSMWDEVYPQDWRLYEILGWTDDTDGFLDTGDYINTMSLDIMEEREYFVNAVGTDITVGKLPWICEDDPADQFFGVAPIVEVAGFPHEDRDYCPWHNKDYSVPLPHIVNDGGLVPPFMPPGGFIDLYVCYPDPYGGQGWYKNASMIWPQKEFCFKANVTYAGWPEQYKDVALQLIDPTGTTWGIWSGRTDVNGYVEICVRMPWPCPTNETDPWDYFGIWCVIATVDIACEIFNDTLCFKYDYLVNIWDAEADKESYKHCEDITVTITYGTYAMMYYNITFAITACDASGVPFGFAYEEVTIGKGEYAWCMYENGTLQLTVHVEKFARPPFATIYIVALNGLPSEGGSAETPVFEIVVEIEPEWA